MLKKHKQLIIGFLLGALVFGIVPVSATVQEYVLQKSQAKVLVDGKEFSNVELPVLNYQGYNYIPAATFKDITNALGINFEWVGDKNEIQITTVKANPTSTLSDRVAAERQAKRPSVNQDGYTTIFIDGVEYIELREVGNIHKGYGFQFVEENNTLNFAYNSDKYHSPKYLEILASDIPIDKIQDGTTYMQYSNFKQNILPLIK